ncbi:MAG: helix-turn-helix transcriptional regulator [Okeania sp. SIO2H7]|nr:helix-turn-helix transcriptional regulator [Okeania sp. SIO2H7]
MAKRPPINKKSGMALKRLIQQMGFPSNADLARSTGIDKGTLSKLFNGQTGRPTVPNTLKIVNASAARSDRPLPEVLAEIINIYDKSNYSFTPEEKNWLNKGISPEAISNNFLTFPTTAPETLPRHNLPTPNYTNFIGRQQELAQLLQLLSKNCPYHRIIIKAPTVSVKPP